MMNIKFTCILLFACGSIFGQSLDSRTLGLEEYLGYVKKYHPIAKQAELNIAVGQANLMKARGGFDPKVEVDYDRKKFKGTEYWDLLNATFKIPTWYGIELKANFEQNEGDFLNAERTVPTDGLFSAGVSFSVARGLLINERMAMVRKAKFLREQTKADRDLAVNQVLFNASVSYFNWLQAYNEQQIYSNFLENARIRFEGVKQSALAGDKAAIDTVEAKITYQNRALSLEQANIKLAKRRLALSNFLWVNDVPVELQPTIRPQTALSEQEVDMLLEIESFQPELFALETHPKLRSMNFKIEGLRVDKRLKANKLLPRIDLQYNFLTETPEIARSFNTAEYKGGVIFRFPLFLRKERGDLKLAKLKLQDATYDFQSTELQLQNNLSALSQELASFDRQNTMVNDIVINYETLLAAEERKFSFGESSLFLVNSRENKLIESTLKQNELQNKFFTTKAKLFKELAINPSTLQ